MAARTARTEQRPPGAPRDYAPPGTVTCAPCKAPFEGLVLDRAAMVLMIVADGQCAGLQLDAPLALNLAAGLIALAESAASAAGGQVAGHA